MEEKIKNNEDIKRSKLLGEGKRKELTNILTFGEKYIKLGEELKKEFREKYGKKELEYQLASFDENCSNFKNLLGQDEKELLESMNPITREKFIKEYLRNYILYNTNFLEGKKKAECIKYDYDDLIKEKIIIKEGKFILIELGEQNLSSEQLKIILKKIKLQEGMYLDLKQNNIGDTGAEIISKTLKLSEGTSIDLSYNGIGLDGINSITKNLEMKEGVFLKLNGNNIGPDGMKEIVNNIQTKKDMRLNLCHNQIGDEGAEYLLKMELKNGMIIDLANNNITASMQKKLKERENLYKEKGINCTLNLGVF